MSESGPQLQLEDLVRENILWAMRLAIRLTGNVHDAEDVVQDALVRVIRSADSFRGDASFRTWFARIIVNVVRAGVGTSKSRSVDLPPDAAGREPTPAQRLDAKETSEHIARSIRELPPRQREVLVLSAYENLTPQQIADVLTMSVQNVYSSLNAARARLRQELMRHISAAEKL